MVLSLSRGILKGGFSSIVSEGKGDIEGGGRGVGGEGAVYLR